MPDPVTDSNLPPDAVRASEPALRRAAPGPGTAAPFDRGVDLALLSIAAVASVSAAVVFLSRASALHAKYGLAGEAFVAALVAGVVLTIVAFDVASRLPPPPFLANLRATFTTSILLTAGAVGLAPVWTRLGTIGLIGILGAAHAARAASRAFTALRTPPRVARVANFLLFQLAAAIVLAEVTLRVFAAVSPSPLLARSDSSAAASVARHRYPPGFVRFGQATNSLGFFDDEIGPRRAGERRILLVGDSFVVGIVPHYFHFATVCERELGVNMIAAGVPAVGPFEYAYLIENDVADVEADEIIVAIFVGNDLLEAEFGYQPRSWRTSWLDPKNLLVAQAPRRFWIARRETAARGVAAGSIAGENSTARFASDDPIELEKEFPWLTDYRLEVDGHSQEAFLSIEITRIIGACRVHAPPPRAAFEGIRRIRAAVGDKPLTILLLPDEFQVDDPLYERLLAELPNEEFERDRPQRILAEFCAGEGIPVFDALPVLRAAPLEADGRPHVYHRFDTHLNRKGNAIVGKALADYLKNR